MTSARQRNSDLDVALAEAREQYAAARPASARIHLRARGVLPGGNTRSVLFYTPFPTAMVAGTQLDIDFMVKDSARFADGGGWGYAAFKYDAASKTFTPFTTQDTPPQANDAKCGVACHTVAKSRDYVFTQYVTR